MYISVLPETLAKFSVCKGKDVILRNLFKIYSRGATR